jgi:hypothetical protein
MLTCFSTSGCRMGLRPWNYNQLERVVKRIHAGVSLTPQTRKSIMILSGFWHALKTSEAIPNASPLGAEDDLPVSTRNDCHLPKGGP